MIKIIGGIKFFKDTKALTLSHLKEICKNLHIQYNKIGENVINFDEVGENFYVILRGQVGVYIPNPMIDDWRDKNSEYKKLKQWKCSFD